MATILIVDGRETNREFLLAILKSAGHHLLQAADGEEALAIAKAEDPDLVITDILMPTMDGSEFVRQLRADPATANIPVIFYTANYHEREARALAATCGGRSVITTPTEPEVVVSAVQLALGFNSPAPPPPEPEQPDELRSSNTRLSALVELQLQLTSELDPRRLLQKLGHSTRELVGARYAVVGILNEDRTRFDQIFTSGMDAELAARFGSPDPRAGVLRTILTERRSTRVHNPDGDPVALGFSASHPPTHAWLGVPLASPAQLYGYLGLIDKIGFGEFSPQDERLAGILAAHTGRVYQNDSRYAEVLRHASNLEREIAARQQTEKALDDRVSHCVLVAEVIAALTRSDSLAEVLQMCAQALVGHLDVAFARVWILNESENVLELQASAGMYTHLDGPHSRIPLGAYRTYKIGMIAHERKPHLTNDVQTDPLVTDKEWAAHEGMVAFAGYPLLIGERLLGVLGMFSRRPLASAVLDTLGPVARHIALVIERTRALDALRKSEERARLIVETANDPFITMDDRGRILAWNRQAEITFGWSSTEAMGRQMAEMIIPLRHRETHSTHAFRAAGEGPIQNQRFETTALHRDGHEFPVELVVWPVRAGSLRTINAFVRDITERKRAEEMLREREERIRLLLDSTAEAIYGVDLEGRCTFANSACARLLGYRDQNQFLGQNMHALILHRQDGASHPEDECKIGQASLRHLESHADDVVFRRADGSGFPAEYWSHPIRHGEEVVGSVVTFLDIAERRELEDQFRRSQQRLRQVVVSSPAVLFTLAIAEDQIQGISWVSDNVLQILGHPVETALGTDWWLANIHPDDRERVNAQTHNELFTNGDSSQEYRFRHGDGSYGWTQCDLRLIRNEAGRAAEAVGAWVDIAERKRAEAEQANLRGQLVQAQKMESIGRLAGGIAHDFNNLLTIINGYSSLLLGGLPPGDPVYEQISEIAKAGERATALSRQLLVLSRKHIVQHKDVSLNDIIVDTEKMLGRVIGEDIKLQLVLGPSLGRVLADPEQLHQVILNLAINARDAMPSGGTLLIETGNVELGTGFTDLHVDVKPGPYVQLKVSDTGIGMSKETMSRIFEPFFTTKPEGQGTGLGLAIVYGVVKQCGGSIWPYSEPGQGTSFKIYLPRIDERIQVEEEVQAAPVTLRGTETILVVEDQAQLRQFAGLVLRSYGYRVLEAANAGEALLYSERHDGPIHLMLTDLVMPGMTGSELAERLKPLRPDMKMIFMSGYSERAILDRGILNWRGTYLPKPFSPEALATRVREVLGLPRSAGRILVVDDEAGVRNFIGKTLTGAGYQVVEAPDGKEAVREVGRSEIDLVITDLAMPRQEGLETIRILHRDHPGIKVIAITGKFGETMLRAAERFGAQATLAKPIRPDELLETVARVMGG